MLVGRGWPWVASCVRICRTKVNSKELDKVGPTENPGQRLRWKILLINSRWTSRIFFFRRRKQVFEDCNNIAASRCIDTYLSGTNYCLPYMHQVESITMLPSCGLIARLEYESRFSDRAQGS